MLCSIDFWLSSIAKVVPKKQSKIAYAKTICRSYAKTMCRTVVYESLKSIIENNICHLWPLPQKWDRLTLILILFNVTDKGLRFKLYNAQLEQIMYILWRHRSHLIARRDKNNHRPQSRKWTEICKSFQNAITSRWATMGSVGLIGLSSIHHEVVSYLINLFHPY